MTNVTIFRSLRTGSALFVGIAAASLLLSACALPPEMNDNAPEAPPPADTGGPAFKFVEDDDPLIAALPFTEDELLARVLPGAEADDLALFYEQASVRPGLELPAIQTVAIAVEPSRFNAVAAAIASNPLFESVHKSYLYDAEGLPDDSDFTRQSHFEPIGVDRAWEVTTGDPDMIIAVLDTGVEPDHQDLKDKLLPGWNAFDSNTDSADVLGHGTAVAGTVGAITDNGAGVAGVCWENPILPIRVADPSGRAASKDIASGIVWAVDHGAKVLNVSFAPLGSDNTVLGAAQYARNSGCLVVISTGNAGKAYTARVTESAIFVGAVDEPDVLAEFSNTGPFVDFVAPGVSVYTTKKGHGYGNVSGTSFASPIVAGVAALVWSVNPDFRPVTIENLLISTAVDLGRSGPDDKFGVGRIDAAAAVQAALDTIETPDAKAPTATIIEPADRATVSGVLNVSVGTFDAGGVADVVLFVDGAPFATDTSDPYRFAVNTHKLTNGLHTLTATVTDQSGNDATSTPIRIIVEGGAAASGTGSGSGSSTGGGSNANSSSVASVDETPPTAMMNFPAEGSSVFTSVGLQATVGDDVGLRMVEWLVDGVRVDVRDLSGRQQVVNFLWNALSAAHGSHRVTVRVTDEARNEATATVNLVKE